MKGRRKIKQKMKNKKYFFKKVTGLAVAIMMVATGAMPMQAFAEMEVEPVATAEEVQTETVETADEVTVSGSSENEAIEEAAETLVTEEELDSQRDANADAKSYLIENYITNNKVITTGGDGVVKSGDGLTYTIGLTTPSGSKISSIRLKMEGSSSTYKSGWYISKDNPYIFYANPSKNTSRSIKSRPASDYSFTATLKLFASDTAATAIDDGTATALATQDFTFVLKAEAPKPKVTFKAVDSVTKEAISGAKVAVEYNWSTVTADSDGGYTLDTAKTYTVTATADGYNKYSNSAFVPAAEGGTVELSMVKMQMSKIRFNVKDASGNAVPEATVKVKQGYYTTINPQADGSYSLANGTSYSYTVSGTNYSAVTGNITPSGDQEVNITLTKNISTYEVSFDITDVSGEAISGVTVIVFDEDDYLVTPNSSGAYSMDKGYDYSYSISAEGYKTATGTISPTGDNESITKSIKLEKEVTVSPEDIEKVNAIKAKFDSEFGALRPNFKVDKNINEMVLAKIQSYTGLDVDDVTVEVKTTADTDYIKEDGKIAYVNGDLSPYGNNSKNVTCTFAIKCNGAEAVTGNRVVTVGWDRDFFNGKVKEEADRLTWDKIKNANTDQNGVESDLTLPQIMTSSARSSWGKITWTSSNTNVIAIENTGYNTIIDPKKGKVTPAAEDTEVTLTAVFVANDSNLNTNVEAVNDFATVSKTFTVTVKGTGVAAPTEESLKAILDEYYTADLLQDFVSGNKLDTKAVDGDIRLPRYTSIKDKENNLIFANKEIAVTTSNSKIISINGYRANVDVFAGDKDIEDVDLIITFTREGVSAEKRIPLKVLTVTDEALDKELAMMEVAKDSYFAGLNDGRYKDADSITGDLRAFKEMVLDENGSPVWIYDAASAKGNGIIPYGYFDDTWEMEAAGYNLFKSSNNPVIKHENLLVTRPETSTRVTITSWLSSAKYGKYAQSHPDNEKLQKLFRQEVSVTVTVLKEGAVVAPPAANDNLNKAIKDARNFRDSIEEGTNPGMYPAGTIAKLNRAIEAARAVAENENSSTEELDGAQAALEEAVTEVKGTVIGEGGSSNDPSEGNTNDGKDKNKNGKNSDKDSQPATGDESNIELALFAALGALMMLLGLAAGLIRKRLIKE